MKCPACNVDLHMSDRSGIEIDYCPQCRGVWLDRGELDKIIERSAAYEAQLVKGPAHPEAAAPPPPPPPVQPPPPQPQQPPAQYPPQYGAPMPPPQHRGYVPDPDSDYDYGHYGKRPYKKRKSLLGELFDFD